MSIYTWLYQKGYLPDSHYRASCRNCALSGKIKRGGICNHFSAVLPNEIRNIKTREMHPVTLWQFVDKNHVCENHLWPNLAYGKR